MLKKISILVLILMMASSVIVGATPTTLIHDHEHERLAVAADSAQYIGNLNSYKFHFVSCRYVGMMNPANKAFFETREEAIGNGYVPCKVCRP